MVAAGCGDKDDDLISELTVNGVNLTTAEDTPISASLSASGQLGRLRVSVGQGPAHGTLVLSNSAFTYTPNPNYVGADSAVVTVSDDEKSVTATVAVTITPVNDPPSLLGTALIVDEDSSIVLTAANIATDIDDTASQLTVTVASGNGYLVSGNEVSPLPNLAGTLSVNVTVADGEAQVRGTVTLAVTAINDAPDARVPAPQNTSLDTPFTFAGAATVSIDDVDAATMGIELSADNGTVSLSTTAGLTFSVGDGSGDASMTFSGTFAAVNAALAGMVVTPTAGFDELITLTIIADDQGSSGSGGPLTDTEEFVLAVAGADVPPSNTIPDVVTIDEDGVFTFQGGDLVAVADSNAPGGATVVVELAATLGVLTLSSTAGLTFTLGDGSDDTAITFSGTFANANTALAGMTYRPNANYAGAATLTMTTTSNGLADTDACAITVSAVNDAPAITGPASAINVAVATVVGFTDANAITLTDIDAGTANLELTVTSSVGTFGFVSTPSFAVDDATLGELVLTGTLAQFAVDLDLLQWDPGAFSGSTALTFVINDQGATGTGGALTDAVVVNINVAAPSLVANADSYNVQGNVPRVVAAPGVLVNDTPVDATVTTTTTTSTLGGQVTMSANGGFTYVPPTGEGARQTDFDGGGIGGLADSFTYAITSPAGGTATGTVNLRIFRVIWFVDKDNAGSTQDGTFTAPFDTIEEAVTAAQGSHYGTYIYVYRAATAYTPPEMTLPPGTSVLSSSVDFDLQDGSEPPLEGESILDGYASDSTLLAAGGRPEIIPAGATAFRLGDTSRISGFDFSPGALTTGPAIAAIAGNSGVIDNCTVDGFATGITVVDTTTDGFELNNVRVTDATDAVLVQTARASGITIVSSLFERVERGLVVEASAGLDDNGHVSLFLISVDVSDASVDAVDITIDTGNAAVLGSTLRILGSSFINGGASGTDAIKVAATGDELALELNDIAIGGYDHGLTLDIGDAQVNALLNDVDLVSGAFANGGYEVTGTAAGRLDLTVQGLNGSVTGANGIAIASNQLNVCLDLTTSTVGAGTAGLAVSQTAAAFELEGYTSGDVADYFVGRFTGSVVATGIFSAPTGGACAEPPFQN